MDSKPIDKETNKQIICKSLQNLAERAENPELKKTLLEFLEKYKRNQNSDDLPEDCRKSVGLLRNAFFAYREAFLELVREQAYKPFASFEVNTYLLGIQHVIQPDNPNVKYITEILLLKNKHPEWPRKFYNDWVNRGKIKFSELCLRKNPISRKEPAPQIDNSQDSNSKSESRATVLRRDNKKEPLRMEPIKESKNRVEALIKYLESRKELQISSPSKMRDIAEFLNTKLEQFMKCTLEEIIEIAKLRNHRKDNEIGDEIMYYSANNAQIKHSNPVLIAPGTKISRVLFRSKLQIYTQLRNRELRREDQLLQQLESRKDGEKKVDKKVENYMLKPREAAMVEEWTDYNDDTNRPSLTISMPHVLYYIENHPWFKHTLMLFNAYQC